MKLKKLAALAAGITMAFSSLGTAPASAADPQLPVIYSVLGVPQYLAKGLGTPPPGANDWNCKPSAAHPNPVVLINGTFANMTVNWTAISPVLKNAGYCVYGFDYGQTSFTASTGGFVTAIGKVEDSAAQLSAFVDRVRTASGAAKVDLVGHSQGGGLLPRYYLGFLGGAAKVGKLVGIAPSQHGTTLWGLGLLASFYPQISQPFIASGCAACADQVIDSPFQRKLATKPDTQPGVAYTTIITRYDQVVMPYASQRLSGSNVKNVVLQDGCGIDFSDHISIAWSRRTSQFVLNALDPAHTKTPPCVPVLPTLG